ncbi:MAG: DNRLRE domain-containing protein [Phycisphaerales bacterium]
MRHILPSLCFCSLAVVSAHADSVTIIAAADNTLYQSDTGAFSNGRGSAMFAGMNAQFSTVRRAVLRFDVAGAVPAGSQITGALLSLSQNGSNGDPQTCSLYRLLASWGEGTSSAQGGQGGGTAAESSDATWIHRFFSATAWSTPGGDFAPSPTASTSVSGFGTYTWSSAQLIADVQSMLDNPAANHGWILRGNESDPQSAKRFSTREEADSSVRPSLFIEYSRLCAGDLNNDQFVDDADFVIFAQGYDLLDCSDPAMPAGCPADLNHDGFIDDSDFVAFVAAYNELICP